MFFWTGGLTSFAEAEREAYWKIDWSFWIVEIQLFVELVSIVSIIMRRLTIGIKDSSVSFKPSGLLHHASELAVTLFTWRHDGDAFDCHRVAVPSLLCGFGEACCGFCYRFERWSA